jgi:hypothetical protein
MATDVQRSIPAGVTAEESAQAKSWRSLYRTAGFAARAVAVLTPIAFAVFAVWPPPSGGAEEWYSLFSENPLLGLMSLDLPFVVINVLMVPIMLALYISLKRLNPAMTALAGSLFLVGVAAFFASNPAVEMLSLSNQFAEATTDTQRLALLGAGESMLAAFNGTAFHVNYILAQTAGVILGAVMLRSPLFTRRLAYLMIVGNAIGFGLYLPEIGLAISALSGVILWAWFILIARPFLRIGRKNAEPAR